MNSLFYVFNIKPLKSKKKTLAKARVLERDGRDLNPQLPA